MSVARRVFITGGTGYMGRSLIPMLLERGHEVTAVTRDKSRSALPAGCRTVLADVLDGNTYADEVRPDHILVHLVGVPHPSPAKAKLFVDIDQKSAMEAIRVARNAGLRHFVYVSVAHPAPVMKEYAKVRAACEAAIVEASLNASILRPWYVLGPGHRWPYVLKPFYRLAERIPSMSEGARRLGLMNLSEMTRALVFAVESTPQGIELFDVARMRSVADRFN